MAYFRRPRDHDHPYAQIANEVLEDSDLSFKAKGILAYLLSRSDDWQVRQGQLESLGPDGRHAVRSGVQELREVGYLDRTQLRKPDGGFLSHEYVVFETPARPEMNSTTHTLTEEEYRRFQSNNPEIGFPEIGDSETGFPETEKPETTNTEVTNTEDTNTERGGGAGAQARESGGDAMPEQLAAVYDTYEDLVNERLDEFDPSSADMLVSRAWGQAGIGSATIKLVREFDWPLFVTGVTIAEHEADTPNARFLHTVLKRLDELRNDDTDYTERPDEADSNLDRLANIAANA